MTRFKIKVLTPFPLRTSPTVLPTDDKLFSTLSGDARNFTIGIAVEVRTNKEPPDWQQLGYVSNFLGGLNVVPLSFRRLGENERSDGVIRWKNGILEIAIDYAGSWITQRVDRMQGNDDLRLKKEGSWTWSEDFLADLLVLRKFGLLRSVSEPTQPSPSQV